MKQLLKATEKYLLKLGSKLKQAKAAARQVEMDENRIATFDESYDILTETEDENDQAKVSIRIGVWFHSFLPTLTLHLILWQIVFAALQGKQ